MLFESVDQTAPHLEVFLDGAPDTLPVPESSPASPRLGADFTKLWIATAASNLSDGIRLAALPLLVASLTRNPAQVAGVAFAAQAPWLLFGLASGAIVDRFDRRRLIGFAHMFRMAVVLLLATGVGAGIATIPLLYAAAFLLGTAETLFDNATQVIVPELVHESQLEVANGRQAMALVAGQQLVGPVLGASLFAMALPLPLLVDGIVLLVAALSVLSISRSTASSPAPATTTIRTDIAEGLRGLWSSPSLRTISVAAAVVNLALAAHMAVFVLFSLDVLGVGGLGYALILACYAVGGIAGGWFAPWIAQRLSARSTIVWALGAAAGSIVITGLTSSPWVTAAMQVTLAVGGSVWTVVTSSLRQRLAPEGMLGRITGTHQLLSWGGAALGALAGGALASAFGLRAPFLIGGAVLVAVAVGFALIRLERPAPAPAAAA